MAPQRIMNDQKLAISDWHTVVLARFEQKFIDILCGAKSQKHFFVNFSETDHNRSYVAA